MKFIVVSGFWIDIQGDFDILFEKLVLSIFINHILIYF